MIEHDHTWFAYETHMGDRVVYIKERCTDDTCGAMRNRHMKRDEFDAERRVRWENSPLVTAVQKALESVPGVQRVEVEIQDLDGFPMDATPILRVWFAANAFRVVEISRMNVFSVIID